MNNQQHSQVQQNEVSAGEDEVGQPQQTETETGNGEGSAVNSTNTVEGQEESADSFSDVYDNGNEDYDDGNEVTVLHSANGEDNTMSHLEFSNIEKKQRSLELCSWPLKSLKMSSLESKLDEAYLEGLDIGLDEMPKDERDKLALSEDVLITLDAAHLEGLDSGLDEMAEDEKEKLALSKWTKIMEVIKAVKDKLPLSKWMKIMEELEGVLSDTLKNAIYIPDISDISPLEKQDSGHFETFMDVSIPFDETHLDEQISGPYDMVEDERDKLALSEDVLIALDMAHLEGLDSGLDEMAEEEKEKLALSKWTKIMEVLKAVKDKLPLSKWMKIMEELEGVLSDTLKNTIYIPDILDISPLEKQDSGHFETLTRDKLALRKQTKILEELDSGSLYINARYKPALDTSLLELKKSRPFASLEDTTDEPALRCGLDTPPLEMKNSAPYEILEDATDRLALCSLDTSPQDSRLFEIPFLQAADNDNQDIHHTDHQLQAHQQNTQLHNEVPLEGLPYQEAVDVTLYHDLHPRDIPFPIQVVNDDDQDVYHPDNPAHEEGTQLHIEVPLEGLLNQWQLQGFDDNTSYQDLHPREMPHQQDMQLDLYQDLHPENTR